METQISSYLEQTQIEHTTNEAKQQNKIEKNEAEEQKWLKIKKKPKRKRLLVKIEKDGKPIVQQSEGTLQISIDHDTEEADERFAQSVMFLQQFLQGFLIVIT
uniref:Bm1087 n=1 Tax=Brugia malayi TaxID=6279 RepID=A0A0H5S091_BRUMA|nr:Bm1087 [Brugia malayi]